MLQCSQSTILNKRILMQPNNKDYGSDLPLLIASIYVSFQNYFDDVNYRDMQHKKALTIKAGATKKIPYNS